MIVSVNAIPDKQTNMSQDTLGAVEIQEGKAAPKIVRKRKREFSFLAGAVVLIALAAVVAKMPAPRTQPVQGHSDDAAEMTVTVVHPQKAPISIPVLPGRTEAYTDAPIYAQTSGYLKEWHFDIGAKVKAGDILAEVDTPEVDQELAQAQAQLKVAQAALNLAEVTYRRSQDLFNRNVIAAEDFDTAADTYRENQAMIMADQANINQLEALEAFKIIRAPFDGIVTARNTDHWRLHRCGLGHPTLSHAADFTVTRLRHCASSLRRSGKDRHRGRAYSG